MAARGRRHALLGGHGGPRSEPFLPVVGEVYLVNSLLYSASDPAAGRPAVVVEVPEPTFRPIRIVTRTHRSAVRGVPHAVDLALGLEMEGVWSDLTSVDKAKWRSPDVVRRGILPEAVFAQIVKWLER